MASELYRTTEPIHIKLKDLMGNTSMHKFLFHKCGLVPLAPHPSNAGVYTYMITNPQLFVFMKLKYNL